MSRSLIVVLPDLTEGHTARIRKAARSSRASSVCFLRNHPKACLI